ncbi:hypothetical protein Bp8pS_006 [Bacillus phage vB_BpuM-BpSp]|nr:hypothetical protein Bp8pS_006 [Bacillus phage vB_BpuM-BpSp]
MSNKNFEDKDFEIQMYLRSIEREKLKQENELDLNKED